MSTGLEARLRAVLDERYHDHHPFNRRMHEGGLSREEIQIWVKNRYYYQTRIPIKDGLILGKAGEPEFRREWIQRIQDHDGTKPGEGGLELWLRLGEAVGLTREQVADLSDVLPGVRAACDDYVAFVTSHDLLESVAASLTEIGASKIMLVRLEAFEKHYSWVASEGLNYFRTRTKQAPRDASWGMQFVIENAHTPEDQERCVAALERKCQILWRLLDAVEAAHARFTLSDAAQLRDDGDEAGGLVVLPERAVELNASGREILELCDGARSALEIAAELRRRHPQVERAASDTHEFLAQMSKLGVLRS